MDAGAQGVEFAEACGYVLEERQRFWSALPAERRKRLVADFTKRMQAAHVSIEQVKAAAQSLGVEVSGYKDAAQTLAGFEVWDWMVIDWAGPRWLHNPETKPDWATRAKDQENEEEENSSTEEGKPYETLTLKNLKTMRKRKGAPRWTQKLAKIITGAWEGEETEPPKIQAEELWKVMLRCDTQGKDHLKKKHKEDKRKEKRKEKKAKKKEQKKKKKGKKSSSRDSSSSDSSSDSSTSTSSSSSSSSSSTDRRASRSSKGSTPAPRKGPSFKVINGSRHFLDRAGNWINCTKPPATACKFCNSHHWYWEAAEHGCTGGR